MHKNERKTLTSESAPLSAPGHLNVTYSWHRLCTTNEQTARQDLKETEKKLLRQIFRVNLHS